MSESEICINVRLFAVLRQCAGTHQLSLICPRNCTVAGAAERIFVRLPMLHQYAPRITYAVNQNCQINKETPLHDGDELALLPPVSGGADDDWIDLCDQPLDISRAMQFVTAPDAGAIDIFLGTTRNQLHDQHGQLIALDYEAYVEMARRQLIDLAIRARQKWPILRLVLLHRTGRVKIAEPSVLIAVATPHRAESFEACRWLIDQLKKDAAIWKKEVWQNGAVSWTGIPDGSSKTHV